MNIHDRFNFNNDYRTAEHQQTGALTSVWLHKSLVA